MSGPAATPPPFHPPAPPERLTYFEPASFRELLSRTSRRELWPHQPELNARRLNDALNVYVVVCRENAAQPSKTALDCWKSAAESLVRDLCCALGAPEQAAWIEDQTGWAREDVNRLSQALEQLQRGRIVFHWQDGDDPFVSGKSDWARVSLFETVAKTFEQVYSIPFTVTKSPKEGSAVSGVALSWTRSLFSLAARKAGAPPEIALLASWADKRPQAVAKAMRVARERLRDQRAMSAAWDLEEQHEG